MKLDKPLRMTRLLPNYPPRLMEQNIGNASLRLREVVSDLLYNGDVVRCNNVLLLGLGTVFAVGLFLLGCGGSGGGDSAYAVSVARLKKVNTGLLMYVSDWDGSLPAAPDWMDALAPYVPDETNFHSPAVQGLGGYGYALNATILGGHPSQLGDLSQVLSVFDSTDLSRSAVAATSTQPTPTRYRTSNTLAFLDGHVKDEGFPHPPSPYQVSVTHLKQVDLALILYSSDYDDYAPLGANWMDALTPYVQSTSVFRSPAVEAVDATKYGYAMNSALVGAYLPGLNSSTVVSFFDSTILTKNAVSTTATLPNPPRYGGKNTIAYADGHVQ